MKRSIAIGQVKPAADRISGVNLINLLTDLGRMEPCRPVSDGLNLHISTNPTH
jgi:hypothetical protein